MLNILITKPSKGYELIDSGDGEKLERFGEFTLRRPDPQVLWRKNLEEAHWKLADASFIRDGHNTKWKTKEGLPKEWVIEMLARPDGGSGLKFVISPTAFKHTGLFPEQEPNWLWIKEQVKKAGRPIKILNLFGYTGGATLAGLSAGAEVTQVDSSKSAITWAKQNAEASKLDDKKVRWIEDDARKFVQREIKRGVKYDAIIMDPPAFGHGANNELWKIEEDFLSLLDLCAQILSDKPLFVLVNGYSAGYSALAYKNSLLSFQKKFGGEIESGELALEESKSGRLLPAGIFAKISF
jgi:23S rRNA (cytosine1962-C5)-methyltransferase